MLRNNEKKEEGERREKTGVGMNPDSYLLPLFLQKLRKMRNSLGGWRFQLRKMLLKGNVVRNDLHVEMSKLRRWDCSFPYSRLCLMTSYTYGQKAESSFDNEISLQQHFACS